MTDIPCTIMTAYYAINILVAAHQCCLKNGNSHYYLY